MLELISVTHLGKPLNLKDQNGLFDTCFVLRSFEQITCFFVTINEGHCFINVKCTSCWGDFCSLQGEVWKYCGVAHLVRQICICAQCIHSCVQMESSHSNIIIQIGLTLMKCFCHNNQLSCQLQPSKQNIIDATCCHLCCMTHQGCMDFFQAILISDNYLLLIADINN